MGCPVNLYGGTGVGKSCTARTGPGDQQLWIDLDRQGLFYANNKRIPWLTPLATMLKDFRIDGKVVIKKGAPAIWQPANMSLLTPENLDVLCDCCGLKEDDDVITDPLSVVWSNLKFANDIRFFQKQDKVDLVALKRPLLRFLYWIRNRPYTMIITDRERMEFKRMKDPDGGEDKVMPTGTFIPDGELQATPYEVPVRFRLRLLDSGLRQMEVTHEKGGFFEVGQKWTGGKDSPILLRDILRESGLLEIARSFVYGDWKDPVEEAADTIAGLMPADESAGAFDWIMAGLDRAGSKEEMKKFTKTPECKEAWAKCGPAAREVIKQRIKQGGTAGADSTDGPAVKE